MILIGWLKHAFAVDPPGVPEPDEVEREAIERLVRQIVRRGLATPALILLECSHPLNFLASQLLVFAGPMAELLFNRERYRALTRFLERRGSVEYICRRIEALVGELEVANRAKRPAGRPSDGAWSERAATSGARETK